MVDIAYGVIAVWGIGALWLCGRQNYFGLHMVANLAPGVSFWDRRLRWPRSTFRRDPALFNPTGQHYRERAIANDRLLFWWIVGGFVVFLGFVVSL